MLNEEEKDALESAAIAGDTVINAAFSVAVRSQDLDYLAALFQDIAANRLDDPKVPYAAPCTLRFSDRRSMAVPP